MQILPLKTDFPWLSCLARYRISHRYWVGYPTDIELDIQQIFSWISNRYSIGYPTDIELISDRYWVGYPTDIHEILLNVSWKTPCDPTADRKSRNYKKMQHSCSILNPFNIREKIRRQICQILSVEMPRKLPEKMFTNSGKSLLGLAQTELIETIARTVG